MYFDIREWRVPYIEEPIAYKTPDDIDKLDIKVTNYVMITWMGDGWPSWEETIDAVQRASAKYGNREFVINIKFPKAGDKLMGCDFV